VGDMYKRGHIVKVVGQWTLPDGLYKVARKVNHRLYTLDVTHLGVEYGWEEGGVEEGHRYWNVGTDVISTTPLSILQYNKKEEE